MDYENFGPSGNHIILNPVWPLIPDAPPEYLEVSKELNNYRSLVYDYGNRGY